MEKNMKKRIVLLLSSTLLLTSVMACSPNTPAIVENEEVKQIKEEIASYIENFNFSIYREKEQNQIRTLFASLNSLVESSSDLEELTSSFNNVKNTIATLKTDADYKKEEEASKAEQLRLAKEEKIKSLKVADKNQFREDEIALLDTKINSMTSKINSLNTIEEVNNFDLTALSTYKDTLKTNAQYTAEEILTTGIDSKWQLVNDHRDQMTQNNGTITTHEDGYALDSHSYSLNNLDIVFSVNTNTDVNFAGILLVNQTSTGDSLNGYAVLVNRLNGNEFYQVFYLENAYGTASNQTYQYIGGWVYNDSYPQETVTNTDLRVKFNGTSLNLYKNDDYLIKGDAAPSAGVDLTNNGLYTLESSYHLGIITWANGGVPMNIDLKMISSETPVNSNSKILDSFNKTYSTLNLESYPTDAKEAIEAKKTEILALDKTSNNYYETVKDAISFIKGRIKTSVTDFASSFDYSIYREAERNLITNWINDLVNFSNSSSDYNIIALKLNDVRTKIAGCKTDTQYTKEEEEIKHNIEAAKQNKISQLVIKNINDYREEEQIIITNKINELTNSINSLTTVDEVNVFDISPLSTLVSSLKTNAQYVTSEMLTYGLDSNWPLVNEHRNQMTYDGNRTISTKDDGYALDSYEYTTEGLSMSFSVNTTNYIDISGALLVNKSTSGDGLDGYAIVVHRAENEEHYRVFYLNNAYASSGTQVCDYIGGWVYNDTYPGETVTNNMLRVTINNNIMNIYKDEAYATLGKNAPTVAIDLTRNGGVNVSSTYHFGIITWLSGGVPYNFELGSLGNSTPISGVSIIKEKYNNLYNSLERFRYSTSQLALIDETKLIIDAITSSTENGYYTIRNEIERIKALTPEAGLEAAINLMDAIFSIDNAEGSSWDLVNEHALAWTHTAGTNSVSTPSDQVLAGWRLSKDKYSDIDITVSVDKGQFNNPYNGIISKAFLIGAQSNGNYPKGYAVTLFQNSGEAWVQIHYLDGTGNGSNFKFGVCQWVNNRNVRIVVKGNQFSLYIDGERQTLTDLGTYSDTFTLENYTGGSIGILNWDDPTVDTTFTIKEFYGTKN